MEAIGHVLLYFLRGNLPWQDLQGETMDEKHAAIKKMKEETPLEELCKNFPIEFKEYMNYVRSLDFEQSPDYDKCIGIF